VPEQKRAGIPRPFHFRAAPAQQRADPEDALFPNYPLPGMNSRACVSMTILVLHQGRSFLRHRLPSVALPESTPCSALEHFKVEML